MDSGQSSQTNAQRSEFAIPFKETQTKAVREYEETISQLKKENFDLKMRLYLCEEAHKETYHACHTYNDEKEDCIQVIVNLKIEAKDLKEELKEKDEELQNALMKYSSEVEGYETQLQELQQKVSEQEEYLKLFEELPTPDDYEEAQRQYSEIVNDNEYARQLLDEKIKENEKLRKEIAVLGKKLKHRDEALVACAKKYHKDTDYIPKHLRPIIKSTMEAAASKSESKLLSSLETLKRSLNEIMGAPVSSNSRSTSLGESVKQNASGSSTELPSGYILEGDLDTNEIAVSNASVSCSDKASQCDSLPYSNDDLSKLKKENEILMNEVEEKVKIIESVTTAYSEVEEREKELSIKLDKAYSKINNLEEDLKKMQYQVVKETETIDCACQTNIEWHSIESSMSDKNLEEFGTSDDLCDLKEEILMLILALGQKDKELSDISNKFYDDNYAAERFELQKRLADSCNINNDLLKHLKSLERFMEDLLKQTNLSSSSFENINESEDLVSRFSSCLNQSMLLSQNLCGQLSICEGLNDTTLQTSSRASISRLQPSQEDSDEEPEGRNNFNPSMKESQNNLGKTGMLNLSDIYNSHKLKSFTRKKISSDDSLITNSDNVVVLKTSNNEDLILLLNDQGDPKDVLIRNNAVQNKNLDPPISSNNSDQHRRRCWDTPTNKDFWCNEKYVSHYKDNVYNVDNVFKPNYMRYNTWMSSDSDTWSEPDRNVSMQRIGIDVQTSPITSRSPRKSRYKDRRAGEDSTKNESASSYVKLHSFSKRRRSSEISKSSFVCKKCQRYSQQFDDTIREENVHPQELQQMYDENSSQRIEIENLTDMLKKKEEQIKSLDEENTTLLNDINDLKENLSQQQISNNLLITEQNKILSKLEEKESLNEELQGIIDSLKLSERNSEAACKKLQEELNETKLRLAALDEKCAKYENITSIHAKSDSEYHAKISALEAREKELVENIRDLTSEKDSLLNKLKKAENAIKENVLLTEKISSMNQEILQLQNTCDEAKTTSERNLLSSNSQIEKLMSEIKCLQNKKEDLEKQNTFLLNAKFSCEKDLKSYDSQLKELVSEIKTLKSNNSELEREKEFLLNAKTSSERNLISSNSQKEELLSEIESLKNSKEELEKQNASLLSAKTSFERNLQVSNSEIHKLVPEIKSLKEKKQSLESDCNTLRAKTDSLIHSNKNFLEFIFNFKNCFANNITAFGKACGVKVDLNASDVADMGKISFDEDEEANALLKSLAVEHIKFKKLASGICQQIECMQNNVEGEKHKLSSLKQKFILKEEEIKNLNEENNRLRRYEDDVCKLQSAVEAYMIDHEMLEKHKKWLEQKENSLKSLEIRNQELTECIRILQKEKNNYEQALKSELETTSDMKQKEIDRLHEQVNAQDMIKMKSEHELLQKQKSLLEEIRDLKANNRELEEYVQILQNIKQELEQSLKTTNEENSTLRKSLKETGEEARNSLELKQKEVEKLESQISGLLSEKKNLIERSSTKELPQEQVSPDSSTIIEASINIAVSNDNSSSSIRSSGSDQVDSSSANKRNIEKCLRHIKSLKSKLQFADNRIEMLEKEKNSLRENLMNYVQESKRNSPRKSMEDNYNGSKVAELESKLEAKESFNKELRSDLYKANDSLIDKQKEIDKLKQEMVRLKNEDCSKTHQDLVNRFSDASYLLNTDDKTVQAELQVDPAKATRSRDTSKLSSKNVSNNIQLLQMEPSRDRLATTASGISKKLDWIESTLRNVIGEFEYLGGLQPEINETSQETAAKLILVKLFDGLESLQESANEIFYMNSRLKSLKIFDTDFHCDNSKQDTSDHESLLSEETIALSRSTSFSPVSFEGQFVISSVQQKMMEQTLTHSYIRQSVETKPSSLVSSHKGISGSQDSVFQRSHYSSPDLGIESDPNHEHSAPEQADKFHSTKINTSIQDLSGSAMFSNLDKQRLSSIYNFNDSCFRNKSLPFVVSNTLHAIGNLQDFELLKKEISECIVGIKSILSRTGDGMQHIANNYSPRKKLEQSTFKAIKDTCLYIDVCLEKAKSMVNNFWIATFPTEEELRILYQKNEELNSKLKRTLDLKLKQEMDFKDVLDKLKKAEDTKKRQEGKINKQLAETKHMLRKAQKKILENENREFPLLPKHSSKPSYN